MLKSIFSQLLAALMIMGILNVALISTITLSQGNALIDSANAQRSSYVQDYLRTALEAPLKEAEGLVLQLESMVMSGVNNPQQLADSEWVKAFIEKSAPEVGRLAQYHYDCSTAYIHLNPALTGISADIYYADQDGDGKVERQSMLDATLMSDRHRNNPEMDWWFGALDAEDVYWTLPYQWTYDNGNIESFISITKALRVGDKTLAVVGTDITLKRLTNLLDQNVQRTGGSLYLLDATRNPIYLPSSFTYEGLEAAIQYPEAYDHISVPLKNGWTLGLLTPQDHIREPYSHFFFWLFTVTAIALLQALTLAAILSHYLSKPLREIATQVGMQSSLHDVLKFDAALLARKDEVGKVAKALVAMSDAIKSNLHTIETQRQSLEYLHQRDDLTHLPNKEYMHYRSGEIQHQLNERPHLLVLMNIDNFRLLNGLLGTGICNRILIEIGKRLKALTPTPLLVARTSGDEFALIQPLDFMDIDGEELLIRLQAILSGVYILGKDDVHLSLSMGASRYPEHGHSIDTLLKNAAIALNEVKASNKSHYALYDPSISEVSTEQFELLKKLRDAIASEQMQLYYQPQIDPANNRCIGAEALIRWELDGSFVPPMAFIPLAEESKLIIPLGDLVIQKAFQFSSHLEALGLPVKISINISSGQITWEHLHRVLSEAVAQHAVSPQRIALEITESLIVDGQKTAIEVLRSLHDLGFDIAIDDFGTGYSSLSYLKSIPFSTLKLDRMFIKDYPDKDDGAIAKMIVTLAKDLGAIVVAEGMENEVQRDFLVQCGCDLMQGYLYSKPLTEDDFIAFLQKNQTTS